MVSVNIIEKNGLSLGHILRYRLCSQKSYGTGYMLLLPSFSGPVCMSAKQSVYSATTDGVTTVLPDQFLTAE